jgi:hypothetical protein
VKPATTEQWRVVSWLSFSLAGQSAIVAHGDVFDRLDEFGLNESRHVESELVRRRLRAWSDR